MKYIATTTTKNIAKCIGGGVGKKSGVILIQKCFFSSDNPLDSEPVVSWHGLMDEDSQNTNFQITVTNCYLTRNLIINGYFRSGDTVFLLYCGNANRANPYLQSGLESVVFNNQINQ